MSFDNEVARSLADKAKENASNMDRVAAASLRFLNDYFAAVDEAHAYLVAHLKPTRMLLEERMIRSNRYSPDGYVLHRRNLFHGLPGIPASSTPRSTAFDMILTSGEVWRKQVEGTSGDFYDPEDEPAGSVRRIHIFGLNVWSSPDGAVAQPSKNSEEQVRPFREWLVQVCAEAHNIHEARAA